MSLTTITIGANTYTVYASVSEADAYLAADPNRGPTWAGLTPDEKNINLVAATRRIDFENYQGEKTGGSAQETDWPRTGLTYKDSGDPVPTNEVPLDVENACILQAGSIALDATTATNTGSASNIKEVMAGSTGVKFFRQQGGTVFQDQDVFALLQQWLEGFGAGSADTGNAVFGNGDESSFTDCKKYDRVEGFS